jgi:hypothetical protein
VTREGILAHFRTLKVAPDEGLLIYYGGHGGRTPGGELFLALEREKGKPFLRSDLRRTMESKKAALVVILTDSCSNTVKLPKEVIPKAAMMPEKTRPVLDPVARSLFFQARGTVDITAATNEVAFGDDERGGLFTEAFSMVMHSPLPQLDTNRDGLLTWQEFFPIIQKETEQSFARWAADLRSRGEKISATTQSPHALSLGQAQKGGPPTAGPPARAFAVVNLANLTTREMKFRHRWEGDTEWRAAALRPNEKAQIKRDLGERKVPPTLEVDFTAGKTPAQRLMPSTWAGKGEPGPEQGKRYEFKLRKTSAPKSDKGG